MTPATPDSEDRLHVYASGTLDPFREGSASESLSPIEWCIMVSISDRLFELNERGLPDPNLVSSYTVSGNGTIYRFQIHSDRRFHNGDEVTADDVIHSLIRAARLYPEGSRLFDLADLTLARGAIEGNGLRRISRFRFEMQLRDRCEGLLHYLALPINSVRSRQAVEGTWDGFSGPYRVAGHDPAEWELRLTRDHPQAHPRAFEDIVIRGTAADRGPFDLTQFALSGPTSNVAAGDSPDGPSVAVFGEPFPAPPRPLGALKERLVRLPGECLFYLRGRSDAAGLEHHVRTLQQVVASPNLQRVFVGLKPPTFIPLVPAGLVDRGSTAARASAGDEFVVAVDQGSLRDDFLQALESDCQARGARVRFVSRTPDPGAKPPECHAYLRSIFVGHSVDELGFLRRLVEESLPGTRSPGKFFLASLSAAARTSHRSTRADAIRLLARDLGSELGVLPLFQATAGVLVDARVDREALNASSGFTSLASLRRRTAKFDHAEMNRAMLTALGAATQMFAHDVRRPFSMVRILLDMIRNAGSLAEAKEVAIRMMPEIERALGAVNGMIQDILEIGTAREPAREVVAPERALEAGLREVFEMRAGADVRFTFRFAHTRPFHASQHQVHRVFANILSNAADAMQNQGEITCETEDVIAGGQFFVRVGLGNSGPRIDPAELPRIFDAFYSKGKRGGTGLGLAITKKIIEAHEGRIWCISHETDGVQFCFTLPAHESEIVATDDLPRNSQEIVEQYQQRTALTLGDEERRANERERLLAGNLSTFRSAHQRRLRIWVIDDEAIYAEGVRSLIKDAFWFEENVEVVSLVDEASALRALGDGGPDACICDIDLGGGSPDGFAVTQRLRQRGVRAVIYLHSNRSGPADYRQAIEAGADAFLPKPMSRPHLLRLLDEAVREGAVRPRETERDLPEAGPAGRREPTIVVVDDEIFMRKAWSSRVLDARILAYRGPTEFWTRHQATAFDWRDIDCVITDFHFGAGEAERIEEFIPKLRAAGYRGPILLSSDTCEAESILNLIDRKIDKRPISWRQIQSLLEEHER